MNNILWIVLVWGSCAFCSCGQKQKTITVENPSEYDRTEVVAIPFDQFSEHFGVDTIFTIRDSSGNIYPHQLETLGQSTPQNVLVLVDIVAGGNTVLSVTDDAPPVFEAKTYARYVPERFDDFAWENDVVAFRMYGKALEGRPDDAQGMDYWAKRTPKLVVDAWYKGNDYHKDHGDGLDYYSVGQTLGAGDIALFTADTLFYTKHYRTYQILDNGPIRTTFVLNYDPEVLDGGEISLKKTVTIDAGSSFNKIKVDFQNSERDVTDVVVGIAKRNELVPKYQAGVDNRYLAYWEPPIEDHGETGVAIILTEQKAALLANRPEQFLLKLQVKNDVPFVYYNGAAWNKAGRVRHAEEWFAAVKKQQEHVDKPMRVKLN